MRIRPWIAWGLLLLVVLGVGGTAWALSAAGYQKFVVKTGSMSPTIKPGDLVIDRAVDGELAVGDVITFRDSQAELVTHRIAAMSGEGITTKGDANETADVSRIHIQDVVGVVAFVVPKGGYVVLFLSQPAGLIAVLAAVIGLVLLWRIFFPADDKTGDGESADPRRTPVGPDPQEVDGAAGPSDPASEINAESVEPLGDREALRSHRAQRRRGRHAEPPPPDRAVEAEPIDH